MAKDANQDGYFVGPTIFAEVKRGMQIYVSRLQLEGMQLRCRTWLLKIC